ncbi:Folylpolyglutamate synthase [bioreactor metagenome]|uniref:Folylpolyglutamate synthase n=1 Tax=bioreactor metagenome TaxID=1076179 RepID=A0A644ZFS2_9ZZZZ
MGGRLDATNVLETPEVSVITHIGLDHTQQLGDTLEQIAWEKGGIIKPGCPAVLYGQGPGVTRTIEEICREKGAELCHASASEARLTEMTVDGLVFDWAGYEGLKTSLTGLHQLGNAVTAARAAQVLAGRGWRIDETALRAGLAGAGCIGRLELLSRSPVFLVDGAHNPQGVEAMLESLRLLFPDKRFVFLMGMLADKDYASAVRLILPLASRVYTITPPVPRALPAEELAGLIRAGGPVSAQAFGSVREAVEAALSDAGPEDVLCAFGSLYQIGEIRACFGLAEREPWKE